MALSFTCEKCGGRLRAKRMKKLDDEIYRERICSSCGKIQYTVEFPIAENEKFAECWEKAKTYSTERTK